MSGPTRPEGGFPVFVDRAKGARFRDVDERDDRTLAGGRGESPAILDPRVAQYVRQRGFYRGGSR